MAVYSAVSICEREGMSPKGCWQSMEEQKSHHCCCPCSSPLPPHPSCAWPHGTDSFLVPFSFPHLRLHSCDCTEWRRVWKPIVQHCPAQALQKRWVSLHRPGAPPEVVSPDLQLLANLIVSVTGCRLTGVEMQDVKLGCEQLSRCFHHII